MLLPSRTLERCQNPRRNGGRAGRYAKALAPLSFLRFDVDAIPGACATGRRFGFYARLRAATLGPIGLAAFYAGAAAVFRILRPRDDEPSPASAFALLVSFCVFPGASLAAVSTFGCDEIGGASYLRVFPGVFFFSFSTRKKT